MLFNSSAFLFLFLPLVLTIAVRLRRSALLRWICFSSFIFYALAGHAWFVIPLIFTTTLDFFLAQRIAVASNPWRRNLLWISLCGNLGLLFAFKYGGLFAHTADWIYHAARGQNFFSEETLTTLDAILPAGISFYTFQTLSYVIDVYRGDAEPQNDFWLFSSFVAFFPHLVAGPLTRHHQLIPALERIAEDKIHIRWEEGLFLFTLGLAKKVLIADRIANLIDPQISLTNGMTVASAWLCLLGYSLQIYFDFSGYSDMAIGLGRLFDVELPRNFDSPYQSANPAEFWRRWHITLSQWLRDYLYIPLGGNRKGTSRRNINILATMVLGGLWHGANWRFAAWGFFHGALLVGYHTFSAAWDRLSIFLRKSLTLLAISLGWLLFRSDTLVHARRWFGKLLGWKTSLGFVAVAHSPDLLLLSSFVIVGMAIALGMPNASSYQGFSRLSGASRAGFGFVALIALLFMNYSSSFLYFRF